MRRLLVFLPALAAPIGVAAAGEKVYRLGELEPTEAALELTHRLTLPELAKLGFSEGRNLVLDGRVGDPASIEGLAQELLRGHPDAIIAVGGDATRVVRQATSTVPIVSFGADPVRLGFAASLAHPGGNVTGVAML